MILDMECYNCRRTPICQNAKRASTAAAPLAAWVKANVQYSHVLERIGPLEKEQATLLEYGHKHKHKHTHTHTHTDTLF